SCAAERSRRSASRRPRTSSGCFAMRSRPTPMREAEPVRLLAVVLSLALTGGAADADAQAAARSERGTPASSSIGEPTGAAEPFWEAIERDDVGRVQTLLLRGADTNAIHPKFGPAIV